jgi:transcriptional repressor NrdR
MQPSLHHLRGLSTKGLWSSRRDGRREEFSKEKLLSGLKKACQKRPISPKVIEELVENIMDEISDKYEREVPGMAIGERVMEGLRQIDKVAYVRFASVYRRFEEATEFVREVKNWRPIMIQLKTDCLIFKPTMASNPLLGGVGHL